jgi:hypothetical protein
VALTVHEAPSATVRTPEVAPPLVQATVAAHAGTGARQSSPATRVPAVPAATRARRRRARAGTSVGREVNNIVPFERAPKRAGGDKSNS